VLASIVAFFTVGFFGALILWALAFKVGMFMAAMDSASMD
jgi:hypothetical protein